MDQGKQMMTFVTLDATKFISLKGTNFIFF